MTIEQKAREIAAEAHSFPQSGLILAGYYDRTPAVEAARLGIIEGLEMAAKALLDVKPHYAHGNLKYGDMVHSECIASIRALIEEQKV